MLDEDEQAYFSGILKNDAEGDLVDEFPVDAREVEIQLYNLYAGLNSPGSDPVGEIINSSNIFNELISQVKFFAGSLTYSEKEMKYLKTWIKTNNSKKMRDIFTDKILNYKIDSLNDYPGSELEELFMTLQGSSAEN